MPQHPIMHIYLMTNARQPNHTQAANDHTFVSQSVASLDF